MMSEIGETIMPFSPSWIYKYHRMNENCVNYQPDLSLFVTEASSNLPFRLRASKNETFFRDINQCKTLWYLIFKFLMNLEINIVFQLNFNENLHLFSLVRKKIMNTAGIDGGKKFKAIYFWYSCNRKFKKSRFLAQIP